MNFHLPFNGDNFIANNFLKLKEKFNIENAIETGTFEGGTTIFLAQNFKNVFSIECDEPSFKKAESNIKNANVNVNLIFGKSEEVLPSILNTISNNTIFYLDAHWYNDCPLKNELQLIKKFNLKPIIAIHDFLVPDSKKLGYDTYNGQSFTYEWLKEELDAIYDKKYNYFYNNDIDSEGAMRGIIYIFPDN
jgi:hypothetical protein